MLPPISSNVHERDANSSVRYRRLVDEWKRRYAKAKRRADTIRQHSQRRSNVDLATELQQQEQEQYQHQHQHQPQNSSTIASSNSTVHRNSAQENQGPGNPTVKHNSAHESFKSTEAHRLDRSKLISASSIQRMDWLLQRAMVCIYIFIYLYSNFIRQCVDSSYFTGREKRKANENFVPRSSRND